MRAELGLDDAVRRAAAGACKSAGVRGTSGRRARMERFADNGRPSPPGGGNGRVAGGGLRELPEGPLARAGRGRQVSRILVRRSLHTALLDEAVSAHRPTPQLSSLTVPTLSCQIAHAEVPPAT